MKYDIENLVRELKKENETRTTKLNNPGISDYNCSFLTHTYNNTLDIIKRLEAILKSN